MQAFLSYHEDEQGDAYASALQGELRILGIDATMARHSIRPGADWALTIREHLEAISALLCIGTTGYTKSAWCQQEIGWAIGRNLPVLWIRYDGEERSVGFLAARQDLEVLNTESSERTAQMVASWLLSETQTREETKTSLLDALVHSSSFRNTRCIANVIASLGALSDEEWYRIEQASAENPQVANAMHYKIPVVTWLRKKLRAST